MGKMERFEIILKRLSSAGRVEVDGLAAELGVSGATVRRDLGELARRSQLTRTHGGAVLRDSDRDLPPRYRPSPQFEQKRRIGAAAATLVPDGAVVGISGGTTVTEAARALNRHSRLTVVTNALNIAADLALWPDIQIMVTGGLARAASFELVGSIAEAAIEGYNLDVVLLGVDGIEAVAGCTTQDSVEARTNAIMVRRAKRVIVLADRTKVGHVAFAGICGLDEVDILITDARPGRLEGDGADADSQTLRGPAEDDHELQRLLDAGLDVKEV
ncbi:MAG TPA: DeoR/GlpR family DNA-binding transcription regulator [Acidimicrobiales bacterium]|jgi:DeoR family transcriptional regulator of aga operon